MRRQDYGQHETVTSRDGTPIAYERSGEGPAADSGSRHDIGPLYLELVLPELQKHFTVYAIDRRGRESGGGDGSAYDIELASSRTWLHSSTR